MVLPCFSPRSQAYIIISRSCFFLPLIYCFHFLQTICCHQNWPYKIFKSRSTSSEDISISRTVLIDIIHDEEAFLGQHNLNKSNDWQTQRCNEEFVTAVSLFPIDENIIEQDQVFTDMHCFESKLWAKCLCYNGNVLRMTMLICCLKYLPRSAS